jgi:pyrroloquinoline-quinone synthase
VNFWDRLDEIAEQHSVLRHPFYVRWSEGSLTPAELAHYSGQYRHAVIALADAADAAARSPEAGEDAEALAAHSAEEASHVELWDEFVTAAGGQIGAEANLETRECARTWAGGERRPLPETLVTMFAIESAQPEISAVKRTGLAQHYGIDATTYFDLHERLDVQHAGELRFLIEERLADTDGDRLLDAASEALAANWRLLDGVEAVCHAR